MKLFLSCDIEGTCGIADWSETERGPDSDYAYFRRQMTREVRAACDGALDAGAAELFVRDAHDTARNLDPAGLPECAQLMRGWPGDPLSMMSGLDAGGFDGVLFTGYHAWGSCGGNPLSHTMNASLESVEINGAPASEFTLNTYTAGYLGVPVCFLSGDAALCESARALVPDIVTVAVSRGVGAASVSMHPEAAVRAIRAGAREAVARRGDCHVRLPAQFDVAVRFQQHTQAYSRSFYPGARLEGSRTVRFAHDDYMEILRFAHFVMV